MVGGPGDHTQIVSDQHQREGTVALVVGFSIAVAAALAFALVIRAFDLQPQAFEDGLRPVSDDIPRLRGRPAPGSVTRVGWMRAWDRRVGGTRG